MEEGNNGEAETIPKKISLLVPSLKIKSSVSESDNQAKEPENEKKKVKRPMPASMRKKLEGSSRPTEDEDAVEKPASPEVSPNEDVVNNGNGDPVNSEESAEGGSVPPKPKRLSRPMPASARKKLESKPKDDDEEKGNDTVAESEENGETIERDNKEPPSTKKVAKPMPASARRKLNGSNHAEESYNGDNTSETSSTGRSSSLKEDRPKKPPRPLPASVRKKFEASADLSDISDGEFEGADETKNESETLKSPLNDDEDTPKIKKRPMPASAKRKLQGSDSPKEGHNSEEDDEKEQDEQGDRDNNSSDDDDDAAPKNVTKPIPPSARKKLEATTDDDDGNSNGSETKTDHNDKVDHDPPKKTKPRPMPASMRRKLKVTDEDNVPDKVKSDTEDEGNDPPESPHQSMSASASAAKNLEDDDGNSQGSSSLSIEKTETDETLETKKINISLGGIKFPTFKKPMPASVQKKQKDAYTEEKERMDTDTDPTDPENEEDKLKDESSLSTRRGRSSVSSRELQALVDEKFQCQYCDFEAYSAYAKKKHEESHFKVKEDPVDKPKRESSKSKAAKKVVKKELKYKDFCPYCDRRISNQRKLNKHAPSCGRRHRLRCKICDKQFNRESDFKTHNEQSHSGNQEESVNISQENDDSDADDTTNVYQSPPASPGNSSVKSKSSASTKSDGKGRNENQIEESSSDQRSKTVDSFKRKIADVLGNLGIKNQKKRKLESDEDAGDQSGSDNDETPLKKKTIVEQSVKGKTESIQSLAMPASVRKKLEERNKDDKTASSEEPKDLHDLECEVCHRVFTQLSNRQRHERTVHSMKNPRGPSVAANAQESEPVPAAISSKSNRHRPTSKSKVKDKSKASTFEEIPNKGKCPVCFKYYADRLRRHIKNVHRTGGTNTNILSTSVSASAKAIVRPSAPKSYKIYKSAADKAKKKLVNQPPTSPMKQPPTSANRMSAVAQAVMKKSKNTKPSTVERKLEASSAPAIPTDMKCACCDEIFTVKVDFNEHMTRRHPKTKRLITCKLCMHMFTHEEDFILHIQFMHKELVSGMVKQEQPSAKKVQKLPDPSPRSQPRASTSTTSNQASTQNASIMSSTRRSLRGATGADSTSFQDFNAAAAESCPRVTIDISRAEKGAADTAIRQFGNNFKNPSRSSRRGSGRAPSPASEPEPMDTYYDDGPASPAGGDESMEIEDSGIAITATFSQRASPRKSVGPASSKDDMNKMPCSSCKEVFYSFEALRKHELYFHNLKTSKMCPICGVYPTRLSRHLLAHEYKTVPCSCSPCRLDFTNFDLLLRHNLEHHPGPDGGGFSATNKKTTAEKDSDNRVSSASKTDEVFRCKLCKREVTGGSHARRHVRRAHPECEEDPEKFLEKVGEPEEEEEIDIGNILEDTNKKLLDSDWDDDTPGSPIPVSKPSTSNKKPKRPMPASIRAKLLGAKTEPNDVPTSSLIERKATTSEPKVVKRPMPASMRARLEGKKLPNEVIISPASVKQDVMQEEPKPKPVVKRAMPASIRAKLERHKNDSGEPVAASTLPTIKAKPGKPMPASMRAKLMSKSHSSSGSVISDTVSNSSKISSSADKPKPKRPMPASMRARMLNKAELKEVSPSRPPRPIETYSPEPISYNDDSNHSYSRPGNNSRVEHGRRRETSADVVTLEDDDDDLAVVAVISDSVPVPVTGGLSFNIADEIAEHNKTVEIVTIGDTSSGASTSKSFNSHVSRNVACIYKCKLCDRSFDSGDNIRRHIQLEHDEYGPEHMENLIGTIYQESLPEVPRQRRSNVNYHKSYTVDDDEEEVIVSRGTSTRPRGSAAVPPPSFSHHAEPASSPAISHSVENMDSNLLLYACKFCGKRMDMPGNVKRHISKAHPSMKGLYEDDVVLLEPGREHEFVPMMKESPRQIIPPMVTTPMASQMQAMAPVQLPPPVSYKCRICQKTMDKQKNLLIHIHRSHPEVKESGEKDVTRFCQDVYENNLLNNAMVDMESPGETYSCGFCSFQTTDEHDYVRHYKKHTGVSPYHCQYCAATFSRQQQLTAHITREHTGAEFLNEDEAEISMEEMVGVGEISVSTAARIQIDQPKVITLNRKFSSENILPESTSPNADFEETTEDHSTSEQQGEPESTNNGGDDDAGDEEVANNNDEDNEKDNEPEQPEETASFPMPYQGDLSSLFPTLGGSEAPGSLADIDMDLD